MLIEGERDGRAPHRRLPLRWRSKPDNTGPKQSRYTVVRVILGLVIGLVVVAGAVVAVLLIDANMLRTPIANVVSRKLDRPFAINGDLRVRLFPARVEVNDVVLGNAA